MSNDNNSNLLEQYKELGLQFRYYASEITLTNRLMLPPLIIGLLVLYGEVEKFLGVEIHNPKAVHQLVGLGCIAISMIWVFNVSRIAQLQQVNLDTLIKCEEELGLKGYLTVTKIDKTMGSILPLSKILRHHVLRLIGFWIYLSLLLSILLKSLNFNEELYVVKILGLDKRSIQVLAFIWSGYFSLWVWSFYFGFLALSGRFRQYSVKYRLIVTLIGVVPIALIIIMGLLPLITDKQLQPDINAYLASGLEYSAKGNYKLAIDDFNKAIALDSNNAGTYFNRGSAYYKKHDFVYAIVDLDKAIALDPQDQRARELRAEAWKELESLGKQ